MRRRDHLDLAREFTGQDQFATLALAEELRTLNLLIAAHVLAGMDSTVTAEEARRRLGLA